jgi:hypothetical protein
LIELLTPIDGQNYSMKKLFGFSIVADVNMFLLMSSLIGIIPSSYQFSHFNTIVFFLVIILIIKFLLGYLLLPVMNETNEDNLRLLGGFGNFKIFRLILLSTGVIAIFIMGGVILFKIVSMLILSQIVNNSLYSLISLIHLASYIFYLLVILTYIGSLYVHLFIKKKVEHLKFEIFNELKIYDFYPLYFLFLIIIIFTIIFVGCNQMTLLVIGSLVK